jgi:hypothetical protein
MTPEETGAARGCLVGLVLCVVSAVAVIAVPIVTGWWLPALSLFGILLVFVALRSERRREKAEHISAGWVQRHRP